MVTNDEIEIIEEEWSIVNGTHAQFLVGKKERASIKEELTQKFGHPPVPEDIEWVRLNRQLSEEAGNNCWGAYTSTRLQMAEALRKQNRLNEALRIYLEVSYLHQNGPQNCTIYRYKVSQPREELRFSPKDGFMVAEVYRITAIIKKTKVRVSDLKELFLEIAVVQFKNLGLPLTPDQGWNLLYEEIKTIYNQD